MNNNDNKTAKKNHIKLVELDNFLAPYEKIINDRYEHALWKLNQLTQNGRISLSNFANGHLYFGLHKTSDGWIFREWAPNATKIFLIGDFNDWKENEAYRCEKILDENWELKLSSDKIKNGDLYKLKIYWKGGSGERIPAYCQYVVQNNETKVFSAQVLESENSYTWNDQRFKSHKEFPLIYECHIGMAQEKEGVGTYTEFKEKILPRIAEAGYNFIQIMAIQEHPYYGSFGYHVSSFFAPSSRYGTPNDLKSLIDAAHQMGIGVLLDIVHSHSVKNEIEGLGNFCGDPNQYFYEGEHHEHFAWNSLCFDYGKNEVLHFLLSNCKYWLEEFHFDGFRFDGVTSMLYYDHGLGKAFANYEDYFNGHQDDNAICYLMLANKLIHEVKLDALTIAEDVSGMPGLASNFEDKGYGFNYRLSLNIPDYWIKLIKEQSDENWKPSNIFYELTNRRAEEKTISYVESHDQAIVGDQTLIFRLVGADMYYHFQKDDRNLKVNRGLALHKMIRLVTVSTINGGYLNFMGNEFGHPEWIDFPREGNNWSHKYARRQWSLFDNDKLCYCWLGNFDRRMLKIITEIENFVETPIKEICENDSDQLLAYMRGELLFVFNFSPNKSFTDYGILVPKGTYKIILNTDNQDFGGFNLIDETLIYSTNYDPVYDKEWLKFYIPARTAIVFRKQK